MEACGIHAGRGRKRIALLIQKSFFENEKIKKGVERLQLFEPPEGYYLAFSGGKDSVVIHHLAKESGVKFDAHYNLTTVDPPELVKFIKKQYPDVQRDKPKYTMWQLIIKNGIPPMRNRRYCCYELKETGGVGRICITGVRWEESISRKSKRDAFEIYTGKKEDSIKLNDNGENRRLFENCMVQGKKLVNPIIDWTTREVWQYIRERER